MSGTSEQHSKTKTSCQVIFFQNVSVSVYVPIDYDKKNFEVKLVSGVSIIYFSLFKIIYYLFLLINLIPTYLHAKGFIFRNSIL